MCLLVKQAQIKNQKKDDDNRKNSKKYGFLFGQVVKERKCKYVKHYVQMGQIPVLKKPLASKNRILDFAPISKLQIYFNPENSVFGISETEKRGELKGTILACTLDQ